MIDSSGLISLLPHRPPMLFLTSATMGDDRVLHSEQVIPGDHPLLEGHFPDFRVWPGVLLIEAMAQTTAIWLLHERQGLRDGEVPVLGAVDCRFLKPAPLGDTVHYRTELVRQIGDQGLFAVTGRTSSGEVIARGRLSAGIVARTTLTSEA